MTTFVVNYISTTIACSGDCQGVNEMIWAAKIYSINSNGNEDDDDDAD